MLERAQNLVLKYLSLRKINKKIESDAIDIFLPEAEFKKGTFHPLTMTQMEIESFFGALGYSINEGNEIELPFSFVLVDGCRAFCQERKYQDRRFYRPRTEAVLWCQQILPVCQDILQGCAHGRCSSLFHR